MTAPGEDRSAAQSLEIAVALAAGVLVFVVILLGGWLIARAIDATPAAWGKPAVSAGCVFGAVTVVWRLLRARRCGL